MGLHEFAKLIMNIFFDLDGTLIHSGPRLYYLFQQLVKESTLTYDEYWNFKRDKILHKDILAKEFNYSAEQIEVFVEQWMQRIELNEWLAYDKPFDGVTDFLREQTKNNKLFLVTARQFESSALLQMKNFGWEGIFEDVFVTCQKNEKYEMIANAVSVKTEDWFVGDTGKDIQTGKKLGVKTAAVLSGFLSKESLIGYMPDVIVNSVLQLKFD